jgi:hypothetical protein
MIIYGRKGKILAKEAVTDKCPNCQTQNSIDMYIVQDYAHVFWIPLIPIGKTGVSQCGQCKGVLKLREMPLYLMKTYETVKAKTKTPIWMFLGLAMIAVFIIVNVIDSRKKDQNNSTFITAPKAGDIFEVKTKDNQYTLFKTVWVVGDSVYVNVSKYTSDQSTGLATMKNKEYSESVYALSKKELKEMFDKGNILGVDRN